MNTRQKSAVGWLIFHGVTCLFIYLTMGGVVDVGLDLTGSTWWLAKLMRGLMIVLLVLYGVERVTDVVSAFRA